MATKMTTVETIFSVVLGIGEVALDGWIFSRLWIWFVVPLGVPRLGVFGAIGVMEVVRYITSKRGNRIETFDAALEHVWNSIGFALASWAFGYAVHLAMR